MTEYSRQAYQKQLQRARRRGRKLDAPPCVDVADRAAHFVEWCAGMRVPPGNPRGGEYFELGQWQIDFVTKVLDPDTAAKEFYLCVSRRNGKSSLLSLFVLWSIVSPARLPGYKVGIVSLTGRLALEMLDGILELAEANGIDYLNARRQPALLLGPDNTRASFIAHNKRVAGVGQGFNISLIDELGDFEENARPIIANMRGATVGRNGVFVGISTRGSSPFMSEAYERRNDDDVVWVEYAAPPGASPDSLEAIRAANPGIATGQISEEALLSAGRAALAVGGAALQKFRQLHLNQPGKKDAEMLCDVADWAALEVDELPERWGHCVLGFDAGGSTSMTCAVAYWPETERLECFAAFPAMPDLLERGRKDAVGSLYEDQYERGELWLYPGRETNVWKFTIDVADALEGEDVFMLADRYRQRTVMDALDAAGAYWEHEWRGVGHGPHGHEDIISAQKLIVSGRVKTLHNKVIRAAIERASISYRDNRNPSLKPWRSTSRIDAVQALVLALGGGSRDSETETFMLLGTI